MAVRLYVGNLPFSTTGEELEQMFAEFGAVQSAQVVTDRETGRSRGFAFVEMDSQEAADAAIQAMNGKDMGGRALTVNEARPKADRPAGGSRGGFRSSGYSR